MRPMAACFFVLLMLGGATLGWAMPLVEEIENGVVCDPPEIVRVVDDREVRTPADPSQPEMNVLPTEPLVIGTIALAPDVPENQRTRLGSEAYVTCGPAFGPAEKK